MPRKYLKGTTIHSLDSLYYLLKAGRWVFYKERPKHPGFIRNMTFQVISQGIEAKAFNVAKENKPLNIGVIIDQGT